MEKEELEKQYDRFLAQLRVEVDQTFWLYNFFFVIDSTLLGLAFLNQLEVKHLLLIKVIGILFSFFWLDIVTRKNEWRENWLQRIRKIESQQHLNIPDEFRMWPQEGGPRRGLWKALFLLPWGFMAAWLLMLAFF